MLRKAISIFLFWGAATAGADLILVGDEALRIKFPYYGGGGLEAYRCMEVVRKTDGIVAGEITRWEWFSAQGETTGKFYKFKVRLCHISRADLTVPFRGNYEGRTPTLIASGNPVTINFVNRKWFGFDPTPSFTYNGTDNLLVEVWWEGDDDGGGLVFAADVPRQDRSLLAFLKNGEPQNGYPDQGRVGNWLHYMRITLSPIAVAPTSLGRVKAIFN